MSYNERLNSFTTEVKMAKKMRNETRHIVTMYGYEYIPRHGVGFIAMELSNESFLDRIQNLHQTQLRSRMSDYISPRERQRIWSQLVSVILALHQHGVVSENRDKTL